MLNNASNNTTICKKVEDIHQKVGLLWNPKENQLP